MRRILRHRPSPAMVVACVALTIALGGTSYAAVTLPRNSVGTKQLRVNAVTSPKVKNNALTGADILESRLARVPSATNAVNATNATNATNASNASNAANAANADKLDNLDSTNFLGLGDVRADGFASSADIDNFISAAFIDIAAVSVTAPKAGFFFITGTLSAEDDASLAGVPRLFYRLALDGTGLTNDPFYHEIASDATTAIQGASGAVSAVVAVAAGAHTVSLQARESGTGSFVLGRDVSVIFVPTGSASTPPFGPFGKATESLQSAQQSD